MLNLPDDELQNIAAPLELEYVPNLLVMGVGN